VHVPETPTQAAQAVAVEDFDFDAAIEAHRAWKLKLRRAISSEEKLDVATIARDDCCALGQWIHGPGGHHHGNNPRFGALRDKHRDFHQSVGEIARKINRGRHEDAEALLGTGSSFTALSTDIVSVLNRFKSEVGGKRKMRRAA
jgi:methyl-accepting chemotaxis protein